MRLRGDQDSTCWVRIRHLEFAREFELSLAENRGVVDEVRTGQWKRVKIQTSLDFSSHRIIDTVVYH